MTWDFADIVMEHLPERWRDLDAAEEQNDVLRRWIRAAFPGMNEMRAFVRGLTTGAYTTPATAPSEMLDWLASLTNTELIDGTVSRRDQFANPYQRMAGTAGSLSRVVWSLTGVPAHIGGNWRGNQWLTVVKTYLPATPLTGTPIATWRDLATVAPTLLDLQEEGTIADLATIDSGRVAIVDAVLYNGAKPVGIRLAHRPDNDYVVEIAPDPISVISTPTIYIDATAEAYA